MDEPRPNDPPSGLPRDDLRIPCPLGAREPREPPDVRPVQLLNRVDVFHEQGEILEPGPLVVHRPERSANLDLAFDGLHRGKPQDESLASGEDARPTPTVPIVERPLR